MANPPFSAVSSEVVEVPEAKAKYKNVYFFLVKMKNSWYKNKQIFSILPPLCTIYEIFVDFLFFHEILLIF